MPFGFGFIPLCQIFDSTTETERAWTMDFVFHDGGRAAAGYKGMTGDCVTRSIAIATGKTYQEVYDALNQLASSGTHRQTQKEDGQAAGLACFARPINTISNRSDGDGPQRCRLVLDAGFICGHQNFRQFRSSSRYRATSPRLSTASSMTPTTAHVVERAACMATFRGRNAAPTRASRKLSGSFPYLNPQRKSHETIEAL